MVDWDRKGCTAQCLATKPFNSQDLYVNSPFWLQHISLQISYEKLVLDQNNNYLVNLSILINCLLGKVLTLSGKVTW